MGGLANCDFNPTTDAQRCNDCIGRREMGFEFLEQGQGSLSLIQINSKVDSGSNSITDIACTNDIRTEFNSLEELSNYTRDGFDLGFAGLSSLVSFCRDPEPDLIQHRQLLASFIRSAWSTFQFTLDFIARQKPDRILSLIHI